MTCARIAKGFSYCRGNESEGVQQKEIVRSALRVVEPQRTAIWNRSEDEDECKLQTAFVEKAFAA